MILYTFSITLLTLIFFVLAYFKVSLAGRKIKGNWNRRRSISKKNSIEFVKIICAQNLQAVSLENYFLFINTPIESNKIDVDEIFMRNFILSRHAMHINSAQLKLKFSFL